MGSLKMTGKKKNELLDVYFNSNKSNSHQMPDLNNSSPNNELIVPSIYESLKHNRHESIQNLQSNSSILGPLRHNNGANNLSQQILKQGGQHRHNMSNINSNQLNRPYYLQSL